MSKFVYLLSNIVQCVVCYTAKNLKMIPVISYSCLFRTTGCFCRDSISVNVTCFVTLYLGCIVCFFEVHHLYTILFIKDNQLFQIHFIEISVSGTCCFLIALFYGIRRICCSFAATLIAVGMMPDHAAYIFIHCSYYNKFNSWGVMTTTRPELGTFQFKNQRSSGWAKGLTH